MKALLDRVIMDVLYFSDYKMHSSPTQIWEENGGASYSPKVAYLARWGEDGGCGGGERSQEAGAGPHILLQKFFSYFPPLKPRCVLWSSASHNLKNMVLTYVQSGS